MNTLYSYRMSIGIHARARIFLTGNRCARLALRIAFLEQIGNRKPPMRGTSGSVQPGPANPARPGREQRYRDHLVCRGVPEVPLIVFTQPRPACGARTKEK